MRVKEVDKTANVAWSPALQHPVYIAAGTAAQQLDATFSTTAALEIYKLDMADPGLRMEVAGSVQTDCRFHKLVWGSFGMSEGSAENGVVCGGGDNGKVYLYNASRLINNSGDALMHKLEEHSGNIAALDINPFQANLLATGGSESEIYIYDINSPANPMTPGAKSQPPDDVTCLSWNRQVQHILASTYAGRCVVWDLRKNEPIIKVSDSMSRIKCKLVGWHPDVATQMCLASEDDHTPVIQLWDLRFATSPLKSLENHTRGILSMAWCPQDPDLLLSCGKDNRILCWNPNSAVQTGEVVYELPTSNQWSFDVQWCPRNPGVISSCSFDGHISVYSLMGGGHPPTTPIDKLAGSFPSDPFAQGFAQQQQQTKPADASAQMLKKPPKWLRRPVGASFAFGGKLVTFESIKPEHPQQPVPHHVHVSQVVTETELVSRSNQLETAMTNGQYQEFCALKIANSKNSQEEEIWNFMKVQFEKDARTRYLQLLGYDQTDLSKKVAEVTGSYSLKEKAGVSADELADKMSMLNADQQDSDETEEPYIKHEQGDASAPSQMSNGVDAFEQIVAQNEKGDSRSDSPLPISTDTDFEGLVTQSLLMANFEAAVEVCLHHKKMAEAITLAIAGGPELLLRTQKRFFQSSKSDLNRLMSSLITRDFEHIVRTCKLESWKEALAMALTYARADEFANLCAILGDRLEYENDILGARLESEKHGQLAINACLCYICAGNVEKLVQCWNKLNPKTTPTTIQDLVEKVMVLRKAVELAQGRAHQIAPGVLAEKLSEYAGMLAGQGSLFTAMSYLASSNEPSLATLRYRLHHAIGQGVPGGVAPQCPFPVVDVKPEGVAQPAQPAQAMGQMSQQQQRGRNIAAPFHQTQAGNFQTTTTPSSTYHAGSQYSSQYNTPSTPTFSQPTAVSAAATASHKGPLAHKYPTHAYPGQPAISTSYDPYNNQMYNPAAMQQPGYAAGQPAATSQPQIYNPAVSAVQQTPGSHPTSPLVTPPASRRPSDPPSECEYTTEDEQGAPYVPPPASSAAGPSVPLMPAYQQESVEPGWNDPPPISNKKKEAARYEQPAPITQPIFGVPQPEQTPPGAPNYGGSQMYNPQAYQQQQQQQQQQQMQQQQATPAPAQPKAPAPVIKGPIPAEHQVLHDVLEKLASQCLATATNPQTKRKLEDVLRKLETLYDKLRENRLSQNVTLGLHQIIQAIQAYDYNTGLAYHTQMISQGNFSEISSFMPGIKMLMQTAMHLQVYVQ